MRRFFLVMAICIMISPVFAQERAINFDTSVLVNWAQGELSGQTGFNLAQAGLRLPTGRYQGEEALREAFPQLLQPYLLSLRVDSTTTIRDLVDLGEISLQDLNNICREAVIAAPHLSTDLSRMTNSFKITTEKISTMLIRHRNINEPLRPLLPVHTPDYTGIIIIATDELPIHGRLTRTFMEPCLFPKIWDTDMNLVYDQSMFDIRGENKLMIRYAGRQSIFRSTPSGMDSELLAFAGPNPLRIIARGVFGASPTDPVIDHSDAMLILSSENNRRLLSEGRIVLVLNEDQVLHTIE